MDNICKLVQIYQNSPTIVSLCKFIKYCFKADCVIVSWVVEGNYWYIPIIYEASANTNESRGWYIKAEPNMSNLPIKTKFIAYEIKNQYYKLIYGSYKELKDSIEDMSPKEDMVLGHIIHTFIEKLQLDDLLERQLFRQELTLSNIAHSIRTPLNGILHMTNSITENLQNTKIAVDAKITDNLDYLNQSVVALSTNIFDIVDHIKLKLGKVTINKESFNLDELMKSVLNVANSLNKSKDVVLQYGISTAVPKYIYSDRKKIKQILINLIENSLQHTLKGSINIYVDATTVDLQNEDKLYTTPSGLDSASESESEDTGYRYTDFKDSDVYEETVELINYQISFTITDTGIGMDDSVKSNLFKPIEVFTNSKQQGLSIKISCLLAEILGGNLRLIYSEIEKGTSLEFNIITQEDEPPVKSAKLTHLKYFSVLLIDSDADRIAICKILEYLDIKFTISSNLDEVKLLHSNEKFHLVIVKNQKIDTEELSKIIKFNKVLCIGDGIKKNCEYMDISSPFEYKERIIEILESMTETNPNYRILIVEDEQINRIVLEKMLNKIGYKKIHIANNGEDAYKMFLKDPFAYDIILIDIRMPRMTGFELANQIHDFCEKKVIVEPKMMGVTAQLVLEDEIQPWFNEFIYKPIDMKELSIKLKKKLNKKPSFMGTIKEE